jgi:hypothetical protein
MSDLVMCEPAVAYTARPARYVPDEWDIPAAPWTAAERQKITMVLETMVNSGELIL